MRQPCGLTAFRFLAGQGTVVADGQQKKRSAGHRCGGSGHWSRDCPGRSGGGNGVGGGSGSQWNPQQNSGSQWQSQQNGNGAMSYAAKRPASAQLQCGKLQGGGRVRFVHEG